MKKVDIWTRIDVQGPDDCWEWQGHVAIAKECGIGKSSVGNILKGN